MIYVIDKCFVPNGRLNEFIQQICTTKPNLVIVINENFASPKTSRSFSRDECVMMRYGDVQNYLIDWLRAQQAPS
jgi:hypothetical protein